MYALLHDGWYCSPAQQGPFEPVTLPHDWLIGDVAAFTRSSERWYRRLIDCTALTDDERLYIDFDGVYQICTLFVNGKEVLTHYNGYTAFHSDITDFVSRRQDNELLVHVQYHYPSGRWYTGAGIYRDVRLITKAACHFAIDGISVTTTRHVDGTWHVEVEAEVIADCAYQTRHTLLDGGLPIEAWDVDNPVLYQLQSELICRNVVVDTVHTTIGFRTTRVSSDEGFFLNDRHVKLKGVCLHHDLGSLGSAVHTEALERQLRLMKHMGANAIRTAHNPPSAHLYALCDRLGLLVVSEFSDVWNLAKNTYDYSRHFPSSMHSDVTSWIKRGRNHPCVIMWSIGNEIADTHLDPPLAKRTITSFLSLIAHLDPHQHARPTLCSNYLNWENTQECVDPIAVVGYNYGSALYQEHHRRYPHWVIYGSETCATVQSRGIYHFPFEVPTLSDDDLQCSALGNGVTSWGARSIEACLQVEEETPYSLGQFIWAGIDYLGEPTPYHTKGSYLGHADSAGFPKDSYYLFQAAWTDDPVLHLFPFWDFNDGEVVDVRAYTNAHSVELFVNGVSQGRVLLDGAYSAVWSVTYTRGTITACSYDRNNSMIKCVERSSFGEATGLTIEEERIGALLFATIRAVDDAGNVVENGRSRINVSVKNGHLLSLDNGDATDVESYHSHSRRLFGGMLLAIAQGSGATVEAAIDESDVPVRAIRLTRDGLTVRATILPTGASDTALCWRLTDRLGVDTPLATFTEGDGGGSLAIEPRGDGVVTVRCATRNGRGHIDFYSRLEVPIDGFGTPHRDPYSFVWGAWYDRSTQELTEGNERGVATLRDRESRVSFADLDFGSWGSDELTIHLFPLEGDPFEFDIKEGEELLLRARWQKGTIWNTYQQETYTLKRRLRSVVCLTFVFQRKVHLKGFHFHRQAKAYARLPFSACTSIIADDYRITDGEIHHVTNNATIRFEEMDFLEGVAALWLRYRSTDPQTLLQVHFEQDGRRQSNALALGAAPTWSEATYPLTTATFGPCSVSLQLLPGATIDLAWLQFIPIGGTIDASDHEM
ncbi:MAG: glycoside hydrolase family 2 TIM barrel-domain containing protein [Sphaerochaeta sp.]|jgi:beta-galactosidase|nr:glycoside hydrolase family 2 TIM barrel-domain containing protein [Sphaerochaeta sp.]